MHMRLPPLLYHPKRTHRPIDRHFQFPDSFFSKALISANFSNYITAISKRHIEVWKIKLKKHKSEQMQGFLIFGFYRAFFQRHFKFLILVNSRLWSSGQHLQPSRGGSGRGPAARDVLLLRLGQGRGSPGGHHGQERESPDLGRQHATEPVAGYE